MRIATLIGLLTLLLACSEDDKRPETADKLKPILVLVNPPGQANQPTTPLNRDNWGAPIAGGTVTLQFHFIGPLDMGALTLTPGEVEPQPLTLPITDWAVQGEDPHDYPGLRHVTIDATAALPTAQDLAAQWPTFDTQGFARLRYTLVVSDGSRELPVAGDFVVYRDNTVPFMNQNLFGSTIDLPLPGELVADKKVKIASTLQNPQGEPVKIGWYVSEGEVTNRRASRTEWELPGSGDYTLVFTVRGKESRNGDIQIRTVSMP
jgi:hypothetical protein